MKKKRVVIGIIIAAVILTVCIFIGAIFLFPALAFKAMVGGTQTLGKMKSAKQAALGSAATITQQDFTCDSVSQIGKHIYYSDEMFERKDASHIEKEEVLNYLKKADETLTEDVFVTWYTNDTCHNNQLRVLAEQYLYGVRCPDVYYATDNFSRTDPNLANEGGMPPVQYLDTNGILDPADVIPEVRKLAQANIDKMLRDKGNNVYGTYVLQYDYRYDRIVYHFTVNEYSDIEVDAKTGKVVSEYYWDGTYVD